MDDIDYLRPTRRYRAENYHPDTSALLLTSVGDTLRSHNLSKLWMEAGSEVVSVVEDRATYEVVLEVRSSGETHRSPLRDLPAIAETIGAFGSRSVVVDITAMPYSCWAAFLRVATSASLEFVFAYVQPARYVGDYFGQDGRFDLSERTEGLAPLLGYANLAMSGVSRNSKVFVPILGFEGDRLEAIGMELGLGNERVVPIVPLPGYRADYPALTVRSNARALSRYLLVDTRFADASCPFDTYLELEKVALTYDSNIVQVAPLGTRPSALGAMMFALVHNEQAEIVFDFPIPRPSASLGVYHILEFPVSFFLMSRTQ